LELEPNQFLLKIGYARALNAIGEYKTSISLLKEIYTKDPNNGRLLRELAIAYSNIGETGWASLLTAERYALYGKFKNAMLHAKRVLGTSTHGSVVWLKAEDLVLEIENIVN
jgi:predicted Zn-dependent protease